MRLQKSLGSLGGTCGGCEATEVCWPGCTGAAYSPRRHSSSDTSSFSAKSSRFTLLAICISFSFIGWFITTSGEAPEVVPIPAVVVVLALPMAAFCPGVNTAVVAVLALLVAAVCIGEAAGLHAPQALGLALGHRGASHHLLQASLQDLVAIAVHAVVRPGAFHTLGAGMAALQCALVDIFGRARGCVAVGTLGQQPLALLQFVVRLRTRRFGCGRLTGGLHGSKSTCDVIWLFRMKRSAGRPPLREFSCGSCVGASSSLQGSHKLTICGELAIGSSSVTLDLAILQEEQARDLDVDVVPEVAVQN